MRECVCVCGGRFLPTLVPQKFKASPSLCVTAENSLNQGTTPNLSFLIREVGMIV